MKRDSILRCITKTMMSAVLCLLILLTAVPTAQAAGVPQEVRDATDSVVFIVEAYGTEQINSEALMNARKENPDIFFKSGGKEYVINGNTGSGFVIKNEGGEVLIATNNHVVEGAWDNLFVYLTRDKVAHAEIVFAEPEKDLSVIRIKDSTNKKAVPLATADAQRGDAAYAVGFPGVANDLSGGIALTSEEATVTDGIISAVRSNTRMIDAGAVKMLQLNVEINSGNSGGPLFDSEGNVIGINTWGLVEQNIYGAVAVSELWSLLDKYGIDIPDTTATTVTPAAPKTETPIAHPQKKSGVPVVVIVSIVLLAVVALAVVVYVLKSSRKKPVKNSSVDNRESSNMKLPVIDNDDDEIVMTSRRKEPLKTENNQSLDDYFKRIEL